MIQDFDAMLQIYKELLVLRSTTQGRVCLTYHSVPIHDDKSWCVGPNLVDKAISVACLCKLNVEPDLLILTASQMEDARPFDQKGRLWLRADAIAMPEAILYFSYDTYHWTCNRKKQAFIFNRLTYLDEPDPGAKERLAKKKPEIDDAGQPILFTELATPRQRTTYTRQKRGDRSPAEGEEPSTG